MFCYEMLQQLYAELKVKHWYTQSIHLDKSARMKSKDEAWR